MRKFYLALSAILGSLLLKAQTIDNVNFTFASDPLTNNVTFTNTTVLQSDASRKAFWSFDDGSTQLTTPLANTSHHYTTTGTYTVCLKVYKYFPNSNDSVLTGQECKQVVLQQVCTADFEWSNSITQNPLVHNVNFNINTSNSNRPIIQVCWNFGDGTDTCINATAATSASLSVHHKYLQSGTYNACIRIKYDGGCVAEKCHAVVLVAPTISDDCRASYEATAVSATSLGRKFIAQPWHSNSKKPVRICWTFGDGKDTCIEYSTTFTGQYYVEHTYKAAGDYPVCVKIKYDGGCEKQKCETIHIIAPPPPVAECTFTLNEAATNVSSLERKFYVGLMENKRAEKICWPP
jgi:PKD repeat protein